MTEENKKASVRFGCLHVLGIIFIVTIVVALITAWWVKSNFYASPFRPVHLNEKEQKTLDMKLEQLKISAQKEEKAALPDRAASYGEKRLAPEPYKEDEAMRALRLTEKELNSMIAKDGDAAKRVAIDLSDEMVSIKLLVPIEEDFPVLGGKTLKLSCGVNLSYKDGAPVVAIRGISVGGVPLPGAWWGDIKNTNLVKEFGSEGGFWDTFSKGVENIQVRDGYLYIKLRE